MVIINLRLHAGFRTNCALNDGWVTNEFRLLIANCRLNLPEWQYVVQRECAGR